MAELRSRLCPPLSTQIFEAGDLSPDVADRDGVLEKKLTRRGSPVPATGASAVICSSPGGCRRGGRAGTALLETAALLNPDICVEPPLECDRLGKATRREESGAFEPNH